MAEAHVQHEYTHQEHGAHQGGVTAGEGAEFPRHGDTNEPAAPHTADAPDRSRQPRHRAEPVAAPVAHVAKVVAKSEPVADVAPVAPAPVAPAAAPVVAPVAEVKPRRSASSSSEPVLERVVVSPHAGAEASAAETEAKPNRKGWWQRKLGLE